MLKAERVGHGYRVLEDESIYNSCKEAGTHFEVCPHSSYLTGSIKQLQLPSKTHPVIRWVVAVVLGTHRTECVLGLFILFRAKCCHKHLKIVNRF